jgi:hypothetical protein
MLTANENLDSNLVTETAVNLCTASIPTNILVNPINHPDMVLEDMSDYTSTNLKSASAGYQATPKGFVNK